MSVLRAPGDGNISEGMGALGNALGMMFDPRLKWEAYSLQQRILQQRLQMQELQRKFGSRDDLKREYLTNPLFRQLPQEWFNYAVEHDIPAPDLIKQAAMWAQAHGDNSIATASLAQGTPWKEVYAPITDEQSRLAAQATLARQKETEAAGTARGTLIGGGVKTAPGETFNAPGAPFAPIEFNGQNMTFGQPSGAATSPSRSDTPPVSVAAQTAPASAGAGAQMNSGQAGSSTVGSAHNTQSQIGGGATYDPNTNTSTITGANPVMIEAQKGAFKDWQDDVKASMESQQGGLQMMNVINQVEKLERLANTSGAGGQLAALINGIGAEYHLSLLPGASALQTEQALLTQTMPSLITQFHMRSFAKPEIMFSEGAVGNARMRPEVLNSILANYKTLAQIEINNGNNAYDIVSGGYNPNDMSGYYRTKQSNYASMPQIWDQTARSMGALSEQAQHPQDVGGGGGFLDNMFGGRDAQAPQPPAGAPPAAPPGAPPGAPPIQPPPIAVQQQQPTLTSPQVGGGFNYNFGGGQ